MRKLLIPCAAALTLLSGAALADSYSTTTITAPAPSALNPPSQPMTAAPVVTPPVVTPVESSTSVTTTKDPMTGEVSRSRTEHSVDASGREVDKSTSFNQSAGHVDAESSSQVKNPDGSTTTTSHKEWSNQAPVTTTTTTTNTSVSQ